MRQRAEADSIAEAAALAEKQRAQRAANKHKVLYDKQQGEAAARTEAERHKQEAADRARQEAAVAASHARHEQALFPKVR